MDPANYLTSPSLAWDAMLKMTGIELEQISDVKILDIIERQKRGGLCFVGSKRHVEANNKYVERYDDKKDGTIDGKTYEVKSQRLNIKYQSINSILLKRY